MEIREMDEFIYFVLSLRMKKDNLFAFVLHSETTKY